ncbi:MAG TPA: SemiSWEET transporter [Candidatus Binatia bacterium]|nr:SemiSWEET transporter [Candidatus Binatia bacterium]
MPEAPIWLVNTIGVVAGVCSMTSFIPQIVKILRERSAAAVSLHMYAVTIVGFICWTAFGVLTNSWPVTLANAVCLALVTTILVLRLRFGDEEG